MSSQAFEREVRAARASRAAYAVKALLRHLPELWGDQVVDGQLTITVDAEAVEEALSVLTRTVGR